MNYGQKKRFSRWRPPPSGILKISIFGHVTVIGFNIWCSVPNSSKSDDFSLRCGDLTIFKMVADRHLGFKKFAVFVMQPISTFDMPFCFFVQNFAEIGQSIDKLWPKKTIWRWQAPPSWILKISIFGHVTVIWFIICCSVPNFIKIR